MRPIRLRLPRFGRTRKALKGLRESAGSVSLPRRRIEEIDSEIAELEQDRKEHLAEALETKKQPVISEETQESFSRIRERLGRKFVVRGTLLNHYVGFLEELSTLEADIITTNLDMQLADLKITKERMLPRLLRLKVRDRLKKLYLSRKFLFKKINDIVNKAERIENEVKKLKLVIEGEKEKGERARVNALRAKYERGRDLLPAQMLKVSEAVLEEYFDAFAESTQLRIKEHVKITIGVSLPPELSKKSVEREEQAIRLAHLVNEVLPETLHGFGE